MSNSASSNRKFVKALLGGRAARRESSGYVVDGVTLTLDMDSALTLLHQGVLARHGDGLVAGSAARAWLTRQALRPDAAVPPLQRASSSVSKADGVYRNLDESPLQRLALASGGQEAFLAPHQIEAGERLRRLVQRAGMNQRVTMSYDPARLPQRGASRLAPEETDNRLDARRRLGSYLEALPRDCAGVVLDVCGLLKGLQQVETERNWPRRSAKLVLRIGLDQLARCMGLSESAEGRRSGRDQSWSLGAASDWN